MKRILITGIESYVGTSVQNYLEEFSDLYSVSVVDTRTDCWKKTDFSIFLGSSFI